MCALMYANIIDNDFESWKVFIDSAEATNLVMEMKFLKLLLLNKYYHNII